ncbi:MAG: 3-hydroxyacyl-CoA dehydrogenase NAD-binding domain-containing protein [Gemmatimonadales bacterium]
MSDGRSIEKVGVVGAGTMGNGIAHVCSIAGLEVLMVDVDASALEGAMATIERNLQRQVKKEAILAGDAENALARIQTATDPSALSDAQLVVEAVPERAELKRDVFASLGEVSEPDTILATNTSSISITEIASGVESPERVIGMHFMNPVPVMKLVEVIRGLETSDATTAVVVELCERLGKTPVEVNDFPGFVSARCSWRTSSAWTPVSLSAKCFSVTLATTSTGPVLCSRNTWLPGGWVERAVAGSTRTERADAGRCYTHPWESS